MPIDIVIPEMGESVRTGVIAKWHKADGQAVAVDDVVLDLETDKVTAEVRAPAAGRLTRLAKEGETVEVGAVIGRVDPAAGAAAPAAPAPAPAPKAVAAPVKATPAVAP
ncbi:MAG: dihydrolipoamide succinyltransferase, partial [Phycisphaeraceae bacterium]|nr:dihydrolipoamide succinyltransferase [Phycisphaeraceae bacterium]